MQKGALPGFRDFYPEDLALRAYIFDTWRRVATRYGFEEYDGPPLESLELYTAKSGDEIVGQLYNFTDKGERQVALRPEMTPTLARMVAARANGLKKPIRWFSLPQLFRYERQQRGRLREHFQLNCDLIGEAGPLADAEVIALAIDVMRAFKLTADDVKVRLSDRELLIALLRSVGVLAAQLPAAFVVIDKIERANPDESKRALLDAGLTPEAVEGVFDIVALNDVAGIKRILADSPHKLAFWSGDVHEAIYLERVLNALEHMGLGAFIEIDLRIVRGLAYYTSIVFEVFDVGRSLRAICGGGRYDKLTGAVGGVELPAVGFGMGDVVLGELLKEKGKLPEFTGSIDVFVAFEGAESMAAALKLSHDLRDSGIRAEYTLGAQTISKQQDIAKSRNSRFMAVANGAEVLLKDLKAKTQQTVPLADAVRVLRSMLEAK